MFKGKKMQNQKLMQDEEQRFENAMTQQDKKLENDQEEFKNDEKDLEESLGTKLQTWSPKKESQGSLLNLNLSV